MNIKRWLLASVVAMVVIAVLESVIHGKLLTDLYMQTASVWRPYEEMKNYMCYMWAGYAVFGFFFALIYTKGYESGKPGWLQGLRFGAYFGGAMSVMSSFGWYAILPIPMILAVYWFIAVLAIFILTGIATGLVYRK